MLPAGNRKHGLLKGANEVGVMNSTVCPSFPSLLYVGYAVSLECYHRIIYIYYLYSQSIRAKFFESCWLLPSTFDHDKNRCGLLLDTNDAGNLCHFY